MKFEVRTSASPRLVFSSDVSSLLHPFMSPRALPQFASASFRDFKLR